MRKALMNKKHWQWAGFFVAGTFLGGWVLGTLGAVVGRIGKAR